MTDFSLVTGASKGIGETITRHLFAVRLENLVLIARDINRLNQIKTESNSTRIFPLQVDLSTPISIHSIQIPKECVRLKALVLNAGAFYPQSILESNSEAIYTQFELNFFSMIHLVQKVQPYFVDGFTQIFVTASSASYEGIANAGLYAASKHAVLGFAKSLRLELKPRKIRVTAIAPGSTWSSSWEGSGVDPNTLIDPQDIAKTIQFVLETSNRTNFDEIVLNPV